MVNGSQILASESTLPTIFASSKNAALRAPILTARTVTALGTFTLVNACSPDGPLRPSSQRVEIARTAATQSASAKVDSLAPFLERENARRIRDRYIVRFRDGVDAAEVTRQFTSLYQAKPYRVLKGLGAFWGEIPEALVDKLRSDARVRYVEADVLIPLSGVGDTTQSSAPAWLDRMDQRSPSLNGTYEYSVTGLGVNIWIVDNGVDPADAQLAGRVSTNYSFSYNGQNPHEICSTTQSRGNHGVLMARYAAGTTTGPARKATIYSARVNEVGDCGKLSTGATSAAMEFIADYSPRPAVINYSAAKDCWGSLCGFTADDAVAYAVDRGVTVVVSAGNGNGSQVPQDACGFSPAHVSKAITVGATVPNTDYPQSYSNYGSCLDLYAPIDYNGGTSGAAAVTSGVAALQLQLYPASSPAAVASAILGKVTTGALFALPSGSPNKLLYSRQPDLSSSIVGPGLVGPESYCSWSATTSGGQPPYAFQWKRNGTFVTSAVSYSVSPAGYSGFSLELYVTDGVGRTHFTTKSVAIDVNDYTFSCTP